MPKTHRIVVRKIGPSWRVDCPRCGMTWTRSSYDAATAKASVHLEHNHPRPPARPAPLPNPVEIRDTRPWWPFR